MKKFAPPCVLACLALVPCDNRAEELAAADTIEVIAHSDNATPATQAASEGTISADSLQSRPLLRPAEVLEAVPGLIVAQHSGDGKANQYYLRGFNLDHGTDFATSLNGMPMNLPTHGHGQGYSDLQFLIPELVESIHYRKGAYAAEVGDFGTAGSAQIDYKRELDAPLAQIGAGANGYRRALLAASPYLADGSLLYALEWTANNGPWTLPEDLRKANGLIRYTRGSDAQGWTATAMAYGAQWNSTDQVPQRAIAEGLITRFGNLDPTDGGNTHRFSLSGEWWELRSDYQTRANAYMMDYGLDLWSDFTFCTLGCTPGPGDQFEQTDRRKVYGVNVARSWSFDRNAMPVVAIPVNLTLGMQTRYDDIGNVGLYTTTARRRWGTVRQDAVQEGSTATFGEVELHWSEKLRGILGWRTDFYRFVVASDTARNSGAVSASMSSPKASIVAGPWEGTEYFVNFGEGFHSNDARGITARVNPDFRDPGFGQAVAAATPLVRAKSMESGLRSSLAPGLQTSLALWRLDLASELVFAGDAGTTVPSFPSRRYGLEWSNHWSPIPRAALDIVMADSRARYTSIDNTVPGTFIPGAIAKTASVEASYDDGTRWSAGVRLRYFGPRPLIEDNSVRSASSTLVNVRLGYRPSYSTSVSLEVLNLFDRKASDIDYYYASRLRNESAPVTDIHTHPSEPRTMRLVFRWSFP